MVLVGVGSLKKGIFRFIDATFQFRIVTLFILRILLVTMSCVLAYWVRFESILANHIGDLFTFTSLALLIRLPVMTVFGLNHGWWKYTSIPDVRRIVIANLVGSIVLWTAVYFVFEYHSRAILILEFLLTVGFQAGVRLMVRMLRESRAKPAFIRRHSDKRVFIVGAGEAGLALLRSLQRDRGLGIWVVGLIDDDKRKNGIRFHDVPVLGPTEDLPFLAESHGVNEIFIAIPSLEKKVLTRLVNICLKSQLEFKTIPSVKEMVEDGWQIDQLRPVQVEDLLGRESIQLNKMKTSMEIEGRGVLVTGAGGSIGSELSRQILSFKPSHLILYERSEEKLFYIERELKSRFPQASLIAVVGDILDSVALGKILREYRPSLVYHAAAYKHVTLMQQNSREAVKNNVIGTETLLDACIRSGWVKKFVNVSTDKAVNPKSTMGYSKRMAELVCQSRAYENCEVISVRFGNVLGSSGSVVEIFKKQIEAGLALTVTDPQATRFFMTTPEAVELVLHAGTHGKTGHVYMLDMGKPINIDYLAKRMIDLADPSGSRGLQVVYTGLKEGEKLNEEIVWEGEDFVASGVEKVFMLKGRSSLSSLPSALELLRQSIAQENIDFARLLSDCVHQIDRTHRVVSSSSLRSTSQRLEEARDAI